MGAGYHTEEGFELRAIFGLRATEFFLDNVF